MQHPLPYAVNCSLLFTELPLLQRPAAARDAGFDAIEFWWPFEVSVPPDREVERFVAAVRAAGVRLTGLNLAAGDMPSGDRGLLSWAARRAELHDNVDIAVDIGGRLGVEMFNALYGNRLDGDAQAQDETALDNLAVAATAAAGIGASVVLEPLSGAPRYPLRTAADVIAVLDRLRERDAAANVAMLADLYHLTVNRDDLDRVVGEHADRIGHVQIADHPGRHEPGTGTVELGRHLRALADAGYRGRVGLEYTPTTTTQRAFDWLRRDEGSPAHLPTTSSEIRA